MSHCKNVGDFLLPCHLEHKRSRGAILNSELAMARDKTHFNEKLTQMTLQNTNCPKMRAGKMAEATAGFT